MSSTRRLSVLEENYLFERNRDIYPNRAVAPLAVNITPNTVNAASTANDAAQLLGQTWASPGAIGSSTPNTGTFSSLNSTSVNIGGGVIENTPIGTSTPSSAAFTATKTGGTTDYMAVSTDGVVALYGLSRYVQEDRIQELSVGFGPSPPTSTDRQVGTSTSLLLDVLEFSYLTRQDAYFVYHVPVEADLTAPAYFNLMWAPAAGWTAGAYSWNLEYQVKAADAIISSGASSLLTAEVTPSADDQFIETAFSTGITLVSSGIVVCHFYRDSTAAADTSTSNGDVFFFEMHYTANKLGEVSTA